MLCGLDLNGDGTYTAEGITAIADALRVNGGLTSIDLSRNQLCGIWTDGWGHQQGTYTAEGITAIADALRVNGALTCVDIRFNNIEGDGAAQLSAAVLGNLKIEMFNEIPIKEMRANSLTELDLNGKDFGVEGVMVVAGLIPVMGGLTALDLSFNNLGDEQTKDLSRMYYVPAVYPGANNFIFTNDSGNVIDPTVLMNKHPYVVQQSGVATFMDRLPPDVQKKVISHREELLKNEANYDFEWTSYRDCPFVNKKLVNEYSSISNVDGSGRYAMIYKIMTSIACNAIKRKYPITSNQIAELIRQLDRDTSRRYQKRPLQTEAERALEYAYRTAEI